MIGVVAIARNTFDVPLAESVHAAAPATLGELRVETVGPPVLVYGPEDHETVEVAFHAQPLNRLLVLQVTFADAGILLALAVPAPIVLWGFPEKRWGGRPRLNSLCGINLAAHALGRAGRCFSYLYAPPEDAMALARAFGAPAAVPPAAVAVIEMAPLAEAKAEASLDVLQASRIGLFV